MTDEKLIEKLASEIRKAGELITNGKNSLLKNPLSLLRKNLYEYSLQADQTRLEDALYALSIGMGHPDPVGEDGIDGHDEEALEKLWIESIWKDREQCPFKDGDIIISGDRRYSDIGIFKSMGLSRYSTNVYVVLNGQFLHGYESHMWMSDNVRLANEEERQKLFNALAKEGLRWNAKEKQAEKLPRWLAKDGEKFYYVSATLHVLEATAMNSSMIDSTFYGIGNYFRTKEAAEDVAKQVREIFQRSKAG